MKNYLCFGCLRSGHQSIDCKSRDKCDVCERRHPTTLHNPNYQTDKQKQDSFDVIKSEEPVVANAVSSKKGSDQVMSSMVVPVWLTHSKVPNQSCLVYALLDSQSDNSFILDQTLNSFPVESTEVELSVSTMTGLNQNVKSRKCNGFTVRGHNLSEKVELPTLYSRSEIPSNRDHFPTPSFCRKYPHLESISSMLQSFSNIEVGLFIGFNCSKALCPLEVVQGPDSSSPFAIRTPLGWSVVGSQSLPDRKKVVSNVLICSEEPSTEPTVSVEGIESKDVVRIPHQDIKQAEEGNSLIEFSDILPEPQEESCKVSMSFEGKTLLELECEIDLIERQLQSMCSREDLKLKSRFDGCNVQFSCDPDDFNHKFFDIDYCICSVTIPEFVSSSQISQLIDKPPILAEKFKVKLADTVIGCVSNAVWNFTFDCLNYDVSTCLSRNVTRLEMLSIISSTSCPLGFVSSMIFIGQPTMQLSCLNVLNFYHNAHLSNFRFVWNPGPFSIESTMYQGNSKRSSTSTTNCQHRDVVQLVDDTLPRYKLKLARLISVNIPQDSFVRSAQVKMVSSNANKLSNTDLALPSNKLIRH